ncbi:MAG: hypothetical protein AAGA54_20180 [Myxococcota bacterium]
MLRSLFAGFVAAAVGVGVGWSNYFALPGAMRIDWSAMLPVVVAFGGLCGLLTGLGLGGGMSWVARKDGADVGAVRLTVGATVGAVLACTVPATLGIAGFAHVNAPYAGTANILGSTLLASATFVALFAPSLHREPGLRWLPRLGLATGASALTTTTLGTLVWLLADQLALLPSFPEMAMAAERIGLWRFSAVVAAGLCAALGVFMGLATWVYLTVALAVQRR